MKKKISSKKNFNRNIDADRNMINNILKFMKNAMRNKSHRNLQITAFSQMFRLMKKLQNDKLILENEHNTKLKEIENKKSKKILNKKHKIKNYVVNAKNKNLRFE